MFSMSIEGTTMKTKTFAIFAQMKNEWVHIKDWEFDSFEKAYDFSVLLHLESGINMEVREI